MQQLLADHEPLVTVVMGVVVVALAAAAVWTIFR
jgi:type II secretory pathway component PulF